MIVSSEMSHKTFHIAGIPVAIMAPQFAQLFVQTRTFPIFNFVSYRGGQSRPLDADLILTF